MPSVISSPLSLELIAQNLCVLQADQRSIRSELRVIGERIDALERSLGDRMAGFEARMETRFDQIQAELGQNMQTITNTLMPNFRRRTDGSLSV